MTLSELYEAIGGDYAQAQKVLRVDKLIDKHIRKFPDNKIFPDLFEAAKNMDASGLFESSHAIKGVCGNLGLVKTATLASKVSEEFRPGNPRVMSDPELIAVVDEIKSLYELSCAKIREYAAG